MLGLNPHAGESGHLGREEIDVIEPVCEALRADGLDVRGPLPADTAFTPPQLAQVDAVLAMYHDQGLAVLKHAGFGQRSQRDARAPDPPDLGRSWHRAGSRRKRATRTRGVSLQPWNSRLLSSARGLQ